MAQTIISCSLCGKREDLEAFRTNSNPIVKLMLDEGLCYDCAYWKHTISNLKPNTIIIDGEIWESIVPLTKPTRRQSKAKDLRFIINLKTQEIFGATGLLLRGRIPERFSSLVKNTYKFITRDEYVRMQGYNAEMCLSKGCFDRYHCVWYNAAIAEPDEPWNKIPQNYVIGSEDCPSFVNKDVISND